MTLLFNTLLDAATIVVLYTGLGYFVSRFLVSARKDNVITWLFLTVILMPLLVSVQSLVWPVTHGAIVLESLLLLCIAVMMDVAKIRPKHSLSLFETFWPVQPWEWTAYMTLLSVFFAFLVVPKLSLLLTNGASIGDDYWRVRYVLGIGFDLANPRHWHVPTESFSYYFFDYYLPGITFRVTSLSVQAAWFLQNMLEYLAILGFLLCVALSQFRRPAARLTFLLACTFFGGLDYFVYSLFAGAVPTHLEWWRGVVSVAQPYTVQISAPYTLFLWVPHHLMAGIIYVLIMLLAQQRSIAHRVMIALLFASLLGFSTFVFCTAALSYAVAEVVLLLRGGASWKDGLVQVPVFLLFALKMFLLLSGRHGVLVYYPTIFEFLRPVPAVISLPWHAISSITFPVVNYVLTYLFLLTVDVGVLFWLAIGFFFVTGRRPFTERRPTLDLYICVSLCVTVIFLSFISSYNLNELFMRGSIVAEFAIFFGAAFFVDRLQSRAGMLSLWVFAPLIVVTHVTNFATEFRGRSDYQGQRLPPAYAFIRTLPKNAEFFAEDKYLCGDITFLGNRVCAQNQEDLSGEDVVCLRSLPLPPGDQWNHHDVLQVVARTSGRNRYFVTRRPVRLSSLVPVYAGDQIFIYRFPDTAAQENHAGQSIGQTL